MTRITRDNPTEVLWMGYNVARNPIGMMPNAPLASDPVKGLHPPILIIIAIHGGQVKRERERDNGQHQWKYCVEYYEGASVYCVMTIYKIYPIMMKRTLLYDVSL